MSHLSVQCPLKWKTLSRKYMLKKVGSRKKVSTALGWNFWECSKMGFVMVISIHHKGLFSCNETTISFHQVVICSHIKKHCR